MLLGIKVKMLSKEDFYLLSFNPILTEGHNLRNEGESIESCKVWKRELREE